MGDVVSMRARGHATRTLSGFLSKLSLGIRQDQRQDPATMSHGGRVAAAMRKHAMKNEEEAPDVRPLLVCQGSSP